MEQKTEILTEKEYKIKPFSLSVDVSPHLDMVKPLSINIPITTDVQTRKTGLILQQIHVDNDFGDDCTNSFDIAKFIAYNVEKSSTGATLVNIHKEGGCSPDDMKYTVPMAGAPADVTINNKDIDMRIGESGTGTLYYYKDGSYILELEFNLDDLEYAKSEIGYAFECKAMLKNEKNIDEKSKERD